MSKDTQKGRDSSYMHVPKCVVFDLDGTLWYPEMFQLSGGSPFK
eukprot:CAMPEP_0182450528 /NCGR_PEP_ID=MMETSP1172-20130603/41880_1 /TAXON_ID=708627 /ORGANISM="Timspurckia oligopyrenoides, Strain CCMP3278" /LENGTH=43 /DNA_ID= /DNA_START= /DNA_END= /DNA_ORIENTATION=